MSELTPKLGELVLACREASLPAETDSVRIRIALRVCLRDPAWATQPSLVHIPLKRRPLSLRQSFMVLTPQPPRKRPC